MYLQGLRLHNEEISRLRDSDMKHLLRHKKLYLVLDLDHTLLNSTQLVDLNSEEVYLMTQADSLAGYYINCVLLLLVFVGIINQWFYLSFIYLFSFPFYLVAFMIYQLIYLVGCIFLIIVSKKPCYSVWRSNVCSFYHC